MINNKLKYLIELKRSKLSDSDFGVPELRKYPLTDEAHVRSAIKFFNYVDPKYENELAKNIKKKMKQYNINDISVGNDNRFKKYIAENNIININNKISSLLESGNEKYKSLINGKEIKNEWAMASCNPVLPINKPYVMVATLDTGSFTNTSQYAFSPDVISSKYLVVNEDNKLEIKDASYFNNHMVEMYEYENNNENKCRIANLSKVYKEQSDVSVDYIYECLSGKLLLSSDQINFDDNFKKINMDDYIGNNIKSLFEEDIYTNTSDLSLKSNISKILNNLSKI